MPSALDILLQGLPAAASAVAGGDAVGALSALGRGSIGRVEVRSQFTPPVVVDDPFAPGDPNAQPSWLLRLIKPEVSVYDPDGRLLVAVAPAGAPTDNYFIPMLVAGGVFVLGAWVAGSYLLRRIGR